MRSTFMRLWLAVAAALAVAPIAQAALVNPGFENGLAGWMIQSYTVPQGIPTYPPRTLNDLGLTPGTVPLADTYGDAGASLSDGTLGTTAGLRFALYGASSARLNYAGSNNRATMLRQVMTIGAGDVDPGDGRLHIRFAVAPVIQDPGHIDVQQPYVFVEVRNITQDTQLYHRFYAPNVASIPWFTATSAGSTYRYTHWQMVDVASALSSANLGDMVQVTIIAAGCGLGAHEAHVYVDSNPMTPASGGPYVSATGPQFVSAAGGSTTYSYAYGNASASVIASAQVTINPPRDANSAMLTFRSLTPPPGATCSTPPLGTAGVISCNLLPLGAGQTGSFQATFDLPVSPAEPIVHADYRISSPSTQALLGPPVRTNFSASQTIDFPNPGTQVFDPVVPITLTATATSGLPVTFSSQNTGVCAVSGNRASLLATGTCTIAADQAGDDAHLAAPQAVQSFSVTPAGQSITFADPGAQTYSPTASFALDATASSGLPVEFSSRTPEVCTVAVNRVGTLSAGTCTIAADQPGNFDYLAATTVTRDIPIAPASQAIDFPDPGAQTYSPSASFALDATASSGLPVAFSSRTPDVCAVAGDRVGMLSAGTCTIAADQPGNVDYLAAATVTRDIPIAPASQAIDFVDPGSHFLVQGQFDLVATATSGLPVTFTSSTPAVCGVSGQTLAMLAGGECRVTAHQAGNGGYDAAPDVLRAFSVVDDRIFAGGFE